VYYLTEAGHTAYIPAAWTDAGALDPFVECSNGRAITRTEDLIELTKMVAEIVKRNKPHL